MFGIRSLGGTLVLVATAALMPISGAGAVDQHPMYDGTGNYAGTYLCIPEASGGIRFDAQAKQWMSANFNTDKGTFVVKVAKQDDTTIDSYGTVYRATAYTVTLKKPGDQASQPCQQWMPILGKVDTAHVNSVFVSYGNISCAPGFVNYKFNLDELRFMSIYTEGYVDGKDNGDNTPSVTVGKCTKVD